MTYELIDTQAQVIGEVVCDICHSRSAAQSPLFGNLDCTVDYFEKQIPDFDYPIIVLGYIRVYSERKGNGRQAMRAFNHWASAQGALFVFLRIGTPIGDYCSELLWRRMFYKSEGWLSLRRPKLNGLVLHWMYRKLLPQHDPQPTFEISFRQKDEVEPFILS